MDSENSHSENTVRNGTNQTYVASSNDGCKGSENGEVEASGGLLPASSVVPSSDATQFSNSFDTWTYSQPFPLASFFELHPGDVSDDEDEAEDDTNLPSSSWSSDRDSDEGRERPLAAGSNETAYCRLQENVKSKQSHEGKGSVALGDGTSSGGPCSESALPGAAARFDWEVSECKDDGTLLTAWGSAGSSLNQLTERNSFHKEESQECPRGGCFDEDDIPGLTRSDDDNYDDDEDDDGEDDDNDDDYDSDFLDAGDEDGWESVEHYGDGDDDYGGGEREEEHQEDDVEEEREAGTGGESMDIINEEELFITSLLVGNLLSMAERGEQSSGVSSGERREESSSGTNQPEHSDPAGPESSGLWNQIPRVEGVFWKATERQPLESFHAHATTPSVQDSVRMILWDEEYLNEIFELLPGVDPADVYLQSTIHALRGPSRPH